jgi:hypothetical protein
MPPRDVQQHLTCTAEKQLLPKGRCGRCMHMPWALLATHILFQHLCFVCHKTHPIQPVRKGSVAVDSMADAQQQRKQ